MERIRAENKARNRIFRKKPVLVFAVFSIILMIVLKTYPTLIDNFISDQKAGLMELYTESLKPLMFTNNITNEDVFNLAFNSILPIDKEKKQMLELSKDENGNKFFEVKYAGNVTSSLNLKSFVKSLNLNQKQEKQVDSILESYSDDIASQVLVNDNKVVAVNPKLINYQNALKADLLSFAANTNNIEVKRIFPENFNTKEFSKISKQFMVTTGGDKNVYCFITPDTVFYQHLEIDKNNLLKEIEEFKKEKSLHQREKEFKVEIKVAPEGFVSNKKLKFFNENNFRKVEIPKDLSVINHIPNMDSITVIIDDALISLKDLNISIKIDSLVKKNNKLFKYKTERIPKGYDYDIKSDNYIKINPDSLTKMFKHYFGDSSKTMIPKEFNVEIEEFREKMEELKKEMENLYKEFKDNNAKKSKKAPIVI